VLAAAVSNHGAAANTSAAGPESNRRASHPHRHGETLHAPLPFPSRIDKLTLPYTLQEQFKRLL